MLRKARTSTTIERRGNTWSCSLIRIIIIGLEESEDIKNENKSDNETMEPAHQGV